MPQVCCQLHLMLLERVRCGTDQEGVSLLFIWPVGITLYIQASSLGWEEPFGRLLGGLAPCRNKQRLKSSKLFEVLCVLYSGSGHVLLNVS